MIQLKKGREEIMYLLARAIEKYKSETGRIIIQNTNRKNYEGLAEALSEISNKLPETSETLIHEVYLPDTSHADSKYPFRKYDITGGQIKDAISGIVSKPRNFLLDACYIYLYGVGRKGFEQNPIDANLILDEEEDLLNNNKPNDLASSSPKPVNATIQAQSNSISKNIIGILSASLLIAIFAFFYVNRKWQVTKKDMNILSYQPSKAEIDSLEGVWLCYTGSPQARISDDNRYHKVVPNILDIKYKNGYFTLTRYGASFNHTGYAQFEAPNIVSIYSRVKSKKDSTESPRHSLLTLNSGKKYIPVISASWNFDIGEKNKIIGIREVLIKQGKGGTIEEVMNEIENSSCQCKIIRWHLENNQVKTFHLKNELLDSLNISEIKSLIDEHSILLKDQKDSTMISKGRH